MNNLFKALESRVEVSTSIPYTISSDDNKTYLQLAVPGFTKDELTIELDNTYLTISGKRNAEVAKGVTLKSFNGTIATEFNTKFRVAEGSEVKEAILENGILNINLEYKIRDTRRRVIIK